MARSGYDPFPGSSGGSSGYDPFPRYKKASRRSLTAQQLLALQAAQKLKHSSSFWDEIKHAGSAGLHPVGWTFDKLLRPEYAVATAVDQAIHGGVGGALHGARAGFMGHGDHGFGEVLAHHGVLKGHGILRGLAGFGLDVAADPLTYVSGGTAILTKSAEHAAVEAAGTRAIKGLSRESFKKNASGEIAAKAADHQVLRNAGKDYQHRAALAAQQLKHMEAAAKGKPLGQEATAKLHIMQEVARAEHGRVEQRLPYYKFGGRKHGVQITPTRVAGKQVVPALPKLRNVALARNVPVLSAMGRKVGDYFVPGFREPEVHAAEITTKHLGEQLHGQLLHAINELHHEVPQLSKEDQLRALHYFERPAKSSKGHQIKSVLKRGNKYVLNEGYISKLKAEGKLSNAQEKFVRFMHDASNMLYHQDRAFGHTYDHAGERGILYVPHLVDRSGHPLSDAQKNLLTKAGFERQRGTENFSVLQLSKKHLEGELGKSVETDPYKLLVHRTRASANKQADLALLHSFTEGIGKPTRVVDEAKLAATRIAREAAQHKQTAVLANAHAEEQKFLANHSRTFADEHKRLTDMMRKHKYGRNTQQKAANLTRIGGKIDKLQRRYAKETQQIAKGTHKPLNDVLEIHRAESANLDKEVARLDSVEKSLLRGRQARGYSKDMKTVTGAIDKFGHPIQFEPEVAHSIERVHRVVTGEDKAINDFSHGWSKWIANWKLLVTSVNPGYRIRNTMSDVWAMYVSGMPAHAIGSYGTKAAKLMVDAKKGDPKAVERITEAYHHGILSGLFAGDIQSIAKMIQYSGSKTALIKNGKFIKLSTKLAQDMNRNAENWGRLAHYLYLRDGRKMGVADSAFRVKRAHFDYEDLTTFEQKRMKIIAPFYTWLRKNVPFQLKAMAEQPGKYATFPKFIQESEQSSGGDKGNILPNFLQSGFAFQIPFGKHNYYTPQIGAADLQIFDSKQGAQSRLLGLVNPFWKTPAELAVNKSFFTGQDIKGTHPRNPVSPIGAAFLGMIPGSNVGQTSRMGPGGKTLHGPGADPYYAYMLQQIPLAGELGLKSGGIKRGQSGVPMGPELSYLGGQSVTHVDPKMQQLIQQINMADALKKQVAGLRDTGVIPRAKKRKSRKTTNLNRLINFNAGRR